LIARGSAYVTRDVDICYERSKENLRRLVQALLPYHPRLRTPKEDVPILWDEFTLRNGLNFTLRTDLGDLDLLGEVTALGLYKDALAASDVMEAYGRSCRVLNLDALIRTKKAAGRTKDLLAIPELEALKEIEERGESGPTDKK
jgi:hypothetical protein